MLKKPETATRTLDSSVAPSEVHELATTSSIIMRKLNNAITEFSPTRKDHEVFSSSFRSSPELDEEQTLYIAKLNKLIDAGDKYVNTLCKIDEAVNAFFEHKNLQSSQKILTDAITSLEANTSEVAKQLAKALRGYAAILEQALKGKNKLMAFQEEADNLMNEVSSIMGVVNSVNIIKPFVNCKSIILRFTTLVAASITKSNLQSILYSIECILIEARARLEILSKHDSVGNYLKINRYLLNLQCVLLGHLIRSTDAQIFLWPVLNRDLGIIEETNDQSPAAILQEKQNEIQIFSIAYTREYTAFIEVISRTENICRTLKATGHASQEQLVELESLISSEAFKEHVLIRFFVLKTINIHNLYNVKNCLALNVEQPQRQELQEIIASQALVSSFTGTLRASEAEWNGRLFRFLNGFVFINNQVQEIISTIELAFPTSKSFSHIDADSKRSIIKMLIQFLELQDTLLYFANRVCQIECVNEFYVRNKITDGLVRYDINKVNRERYSSGTVQNILIGIPIEQILDRNELRKLKLEAILLCSHAMGMPLDNTQYYNAIWTDDFENYRKELEQELAPRDTEEEEKRPYTEVAEAQPESSDQMPAMAAIASKLQLPRLSSSMGKDTARSAITELYSVIRELQNFTTITNLEQTFNALCAIGTHFTTVATYARFSGQGPQQVIINSNLALNYFKQAELALYKLDDIAPEQLGHYYVSLQHLASIHQDLLKEYDTYQNSQEQRSYQMSQQCDQWVTRHQDRNWRKSDKAREMDSVMLLKETAPEPKDLSRMIYDWSKFSKRIKAVLSEMFEADPSAFCPVSPQQSQNERRPSQVPPFTSAPPHSLMANPALASTIPQSPLLPDIDYGEYVTIEEALPVAYHGWADSTPSQER